MGRLDGKRAIVIGGANGMGAATATMMAAEGATVVVADIMEERAEEVAAAIRDQGGAAEARWVDIGHDESIEALIEETAERLGGLDVLHNNAAALSDPIAAPDAVLRVLEITPETFERVMHVNLRGIWLACRHAVPHMVTGGGGSIINTASLAAAEPLNTSGAYSVSKGAVNTLSVLIAVHYGHEGIRCNAINPGMIRTRHLNDEYEAMLVPHNLIPRIGEPEDIASLVTFLASDESGYITGQMLNIDGGFGVHGPMYAELRRRPEMVDDIGAKE